MVGWRTLGRLADGLPPGHHLLMEAHHLVEAFRGSTLQAAAFQGAGRTAAGNRKADASHAAYLELVATEEGRDALLGLLDDTEVVVQIDVAGRLLPHPLARAALEKWAEAHDVRGRQAAFTLRWWRPRPDDPVLSAEPAAGADVLVSPTPDTAVSDEDEVVVAFHGLVMNGGIHHALGVTGSDDPTAERVRAALRATGLEELSVLVEEVLQDPANDDRATDAWSDAVPSDAELDRRLRLDR